MLKKKVFVIGLGLIGGSIALAIRKNHDVTMIGFDIHEDQRKLAVSLQIIDDFADTIHAGAENADFIVIAAPVKQTKHIILELSKCKLKSSVIITDVGSTKQQVVAQAAILQEKGMTFIGGHPMAGSHKTGVTAAKAHLFENAYYILTPFAGTPDRKIIELQDWLKGTKAYFVTMAPDTHDQVVGAISHFPHIIAASLVHQVADLEKQNDMIAGLAAGGFRDITRIASSSPVMWRDILLHNKDPLLQMLDKWQEDMQEVKKMIETLDGEAIYDFFTKAKQFRDRLPSRKQGAIPAFYDLYVDVPDYPGVISEVTSILGEQNISITNIQIIEAREDIYGVLRLSFQRETDRKEGKEALESKGYETYILT